MRTRIQTNTLHECHSIIPNSQKVEMTQTPTNWWANERETRSAKKWCADTPCNVGEPQNIKEAS